VIELPNTRTGLAAMAAGAAGDPAGHLVLADWLEENLNRPDLAAIYRMTQDDPRTETERERTYFSGFRYQFLDAEVMLCMATWKVNHPYKAGKKPPEPEGHLVGLCVSAEAAGKLIRWVRWLPHDGTPAAEVLALFEQMGEAIPQLPDEDKS
jgi:hypothetical protein